MPNLVKDNISAKFASERLAAEIPHKSDVVVSFVLFNTERAEVERAIEQVRDTDLRVHITLIDNSLPPLDLSFVKGDDVTIVSTKKNIGYGAGHNIALRSSKGRCRYNLVMNTDLGMGPSVMPALVNFMDNNPDVGLVMPKVFYPDGSLQHLCRLLPNPFDLLGRRFFRRTNWAKSRNSQYEFHDWDYNQIAEFPFLSGCFMLLRRSVLDRVGYFDERYFLYAEDLDLSRRISAFSKALFVPFESVVHEYRSESKPSLRRLIYAIVSLSQYFTKWGWIHDPERDEINRRTRASLQNVRTSP